MAAVVAREGVAGAGGRDFGKTGWNGQNRYAAILSRFGDLESPPSLSLFFSVGKALPGWLSTHVYDHPFEL